MEKKIPYEVKVPVIYVIKDGKVVFDYEEMASHFSHQLWMLNKDSDVSLKITTEGFDDDEIDGEWLP
jgi:hypothetical protein